MGVNAIRQYVGIPPRWVQLHLRALRHLHRAQPPVRPLRLHARRRLDTRRSTTPTRACAPRSRPRSSALRGRVPAARPACSCGCSATRTTTASSWKLGRDRGAAAGRARRGPGPPPLLAVRRDHPRRSRRATPARPVAIANGDVQYIDIIAQECKGLDVFGTNVLPRHLGPRPLPGGQGQARPAGDVHRVRRRRVQRARDARGPGRPRRATCSASGEEIYEQSAGKGRVGNAIGGFVFQWSDGWWKFGQESRLDVHDTNASWPNGGYAEDYVEGENNMNEEWWGICAKGPPDARGLFELLPARRLLRAAAGASTLPAYAPGTDLAAIRAHFAGDHPGRRGARRRAATRAGLVAADAPARAGQRPAAAVRDRQHRRRPHHHAGQRDAAGGAAGVPGLRPAWSRSTWTSRRSRPSNVTGTLSLNVLGNVPENPIDEIFYEKRGRARTVQGEQRDVRAERASSG